MTWNATKSLFAFLLSLPFIGPLNWPWQVHESFWKAEMQTERNITSRNIDASTPCYICVQHTQCKLMAELHGSQRNGLPTRGKWTLTINVYKTNDAMNTTYGLTPHNFRHLNETCQSLFSLCSLLSRFREDSSWQYAHLIVSSCSSTSSFPLLSQPASAKWSHTPITVGWARDSITCGCFGDMPVWVSWVCGLANCTGWLAMWDG